MLIIFLLLIALGLLPYMIQVTDTLYEAERAVVYREQQLQKKLAERAAYLIVKELVTRKEYNLNKVYKFPEFKIEIYCSIIQEHVSAVVKHADGDEQKFLFSMTID